MRVSQSNNHVCKLLSRLLLVSLIFSFLMLYVKRCDSQTYANGLGIKDVYLIGPINLSKSPVNSIGELSDEGSLLATTIDGSVYIINLKDGIAKNLFLSGSSESHKYTYILRTAFNQPLLMVRPGSDVTIVGRKLEFGSLSPVHTFSLPSIIVPSQGSLLAQDPDHRVLQFDVNSDQFVQIGREFNERASAGDYGTKKNYLALAYRNSRNVTVYDVLSQKIVRIIGESDNASKFSVTSTADLAGSQLPWLSVYLSNKVSFVSFCYYDKYIVVGSITGKIAAYSTTTWQKVFEADAKVNLPFPVGLSEDLPLISYVEGDGQICLANLVTGEEFRIRTSDLSQTARLPEISSLFLSHDGKYVVAGGMDGNLYAYRLKYHSPRAVLYDSGSVYVGNEAHIKVVGDKFQLKGIIQSYLPLKSVTVGSVPINFSEESNVDSSLTAFLSGFSYPRLYFFSETLSVYNTRYFLSPPMVDRPMESVLHLIDTDDDMYTMSLKFERFSIPPVILITNPRLNSPSGQATIRSDSGKFEISGLVFSNYPLASIGVNGKTVKFKIIPASSHVVDVNSESAYSFSDTLSTQSDTSGKVVVIATDNQGNLSRTSFTCIVENAKEIIPPEIKILRVGMNENGDTGKVYEIEGIINSYNPIFELTVNGEKQALLSSNQPYSSYPYSAHFVVHLAGTGIQVDSAGSGTELVRFVASDESGKSSVRELYVSSTPPYVIDSERFGPISIPGFVGLSAGTSTYALKALDYPTPLLDARKVIDAFQQFYNTSAANNELLAGDDLTREKLAAQLKGLSQKALNNDFVVFYFSGYVVSSHGKTYLLTEDSQVQNLDKTALSLDDLVASLKASSQARGFLLMFDINPNTTSLTKFFGKDYPVHYTGSVESLMNIAQQLQNSVVVTGVSSNEKGDFGKPFGQHGLFTYALLNVLSGEADANGNGLIELGELIRTIKDRVEILSKGRQHVSVSGFSEKDDRVPIFSMRRAVQHTIEGETK